jgi:magnesium-transporting ATPase (P-type)
VRKVLVIYLIETWEKDQLGVFPFEKKNLTLIGVLGLCDPMRGSSLSAIPTIRKMGVDIKLLTEENRSYGNSVAVETGLLQRNSFQNEVINGQEFQEQVDGGTGLGNLSRMQVVQAQEVSLSHPRQQRPKRRKKSINTNFR